MVSDTTPVRELPSHLRLSYKLYKAHGAIVIDFIKANGGKSNGPKDWDYAPYLVQERLKGKKPPDHIRNSINMIIMHRTLMARDFEVRRKAARKSLTSVDLAHLSFIDKIRNIQRCWFPDDIRDGASNKQQGTVPQSDSDAPSEWKQYAFSGRSTQADPSCEDKEASRASSSSSNDSERRGEPKVHTEEQEGKGAARAKDVSSGMDEAALVCSNPDLCCAHILIILGSLILTSIGHSLMWPRRTLCSALLHPGRSSSSSMPFESSQSGTTLTIRDLSGGPTKQVSMI